MIYLSRALLARNDKLFHPPFIIPDDDAGAEWGSKKVQELAASTTTIHQMTKFFFRLSLSILALEKIHQ